MVYEVRLTVHQNYAQRPDYEDVHGRMARHGYLRQTSVAGVKFELLGGMYRKTTLLLSIDAIQNEVRSIFQGYPFNISFEVFRVDMERCFNLRPVSLPPLSNRFVARALTPPVSNSTLLTDYLKSRR